MPAPFCGCWGAAGGREPLDRPTAPPALGTPAALWGSSPPPRYTCRCAEDLEVNEWKWEPTSRPVSSHDAHFSECRREVTFHKVHSSGTAVIRGDGPFVNDRVYYWEIKILTALYGTDVMIGIGSPDVDCNTSKYEFTSFLGLDSESYGLSYTGRVQHAGEKRMYCEGFGKGVIVGVRLDMWHGTLEYYLNREPMGIAFTGLKRHPILYPMVSSTASQSAVRLIYSMSRPASLIFHSAKSLTAHRPAFQALRGIPGLKYYFEKAFWILLPSYTSEDEDIICNHEKDMSSRNFFKGGCPRRTENHASTSPKDTVSNCAFRQCCASKLINLYTNSNIPNSVVRNEVNKCDANSSTDDKTKIDLWDAALGNETYESEKDANHIPQEHAVKFSPIFPPVVCQSCKLRMAVVTVQKTQSKQCRECFHSS